MINIKTIDCKHIPKRGDNNKIYELYDIFQSRYGAFNNRKYSIISKQIYGKPNSLLVYKAISSDFIQRYIQWYNIGHTTSNSKNILFINRGVNQEEVALYYNTINNKINKVNYYVYYTTLATINSEQALSNLAEIYVKKLQNIYLGENITTSYVLKLDEEYMNIINSMKNNKIDLVCYLTYLTLDGIETYVSYNNLINLSDLYTLIVLYIASNVLIDGGNLLYKFRTESKKIQQQILSVARLMFESVNIKYDKIRRPRHFLVVCEGYKKNESIQILLKEALTKISELNFYSDPQICLDNIFNDIQLFDTSVIDVVIKNDERKLKLIPYKEFQDMTDQQKSELYEYLRRKYELDFPKAIAYGISCGLTFNKQTIDKIKAIPSFISNLYVFKVPDQYIIDRSTKYHVNISPNKATYDISNLTLVQQKILIAKIGIDSLDPKKWERMTNKLNMSQEIIYELNNTYGIKITRAFCKMYEMIETFNLLSNKKDIFTVHICEAPGQFINAIHYYIKSVLKSNHTFIASSLNPENKTGLADTYGYIKKYEKSWVFGYDNSGDITKENVIKYFYDKYANMADLYTSDCGIGSCKRYEYHNQELLTSQLNCCQILLGIITTKQGGNSLFKIFLPFTLPMTISIFALLTNYYAEVIIHKPITSSSTNHEIYIICKNKERNIMKEELDQLIKIFTTDYDPNIYLYDSMDKIINNIAYISNEMSKNIIDNIMIVYEGYDNPKRLDIDLKDELDRARKKYVYHWKKYVRLDTIDKKYLL
jgi:hypothetical protein